MAMTWPIVAGFLVPVAASAQLIQNGDFSQGPATQSSTVVAAGSDAIPFWTVGGNSVDYATAGSWQQPPGATASIDLNGGLEHHSNNARGSISQSFATTPGQSYTVTFSRSANPTVAPGRGCPGNDVKRFVVQAGPYRHGYKWDLAKIHNTLKKMKWKTEQFTFVAADSATALKFQSLTPESYCGSVVTLISAQPSAPQAATADPLLDGLH